MVNPGDDILSKLDGIESELNQLKEKKKSLKIDSDSKNTLTEGKTAQTSPDEKQTKDPIFDTNFDPDKLVLTKKDILDFCDRVLGKWEKDPKKDVTHIFAMNAVKTSILWTNEESLKKIWSEILNWNFELLFKNALAQAKDQNLSWAEVMGKLGNE